MKCTVCPKTGCMLNLEIQREKEGMKSRKHNQRIGATSGCTLRVMEDAVGGSHHFNGIIGDAWFGSTRTVSELSKAGFEGIFQIKQYAALFPKQCIEEALEDAPGCEDNLDPQLDQGNEEVIRVTLLTFDLKR